MISRTGSFAVAALMLFSIGSTFAAEIREFSVSIMERLGNEIYHRDQIAARAEDLVLERHPDFKSAAPRGWVSDLRKDGDIVYLVAEPKSGLAPAYRVTFHGGSSPVVEDIHGQALPTAMATRYKARQTAIKAVVGRLNGAYDAHYNFEVLNDSDGSGFLVYALAAFRDSGMYVGGHMRVTVSGDASRVEHVDELLQGIIRQPPPPAGATNVLIGMADPVNKMPDETYIYSSKLYRIPIYVGYKNRSIWKIANGKMQKLDQREVDAFRASSEPKKK